MFGEHLTVGEATLVAVFSITVVFLVLLAISYLIKLVAMVVNSMNKPKAAPAAAAPAKSAPAAEAAPAPKAEDNSALVAAITAAVACYLGKEPGSFVVKSITPLNTESDWSRLSRTSALH
jgi:sodium pump decarboxylase gamma subunit